MSVEEETDALVERAEGKVPQKTRKKKLALYAEGLKAKVYQVEYALASLVELSGQLEEVSTSTDPDAYDPTRKVAFYCDSFWTFLYSALDILSQLVNQSVKLRMDEKDVSFNAVKKQLDTRYQNTPLQKAYAQCRGSRVFANLGAYRNCSIHRRQIYFVEEFRRTRHVGGYQTDSTDDIEVIARTLCDDPLSMNPKTCQNRRIPLYLAESKDKVFIMIEYILKAIEPKK